MFNAADSVIVLRYIADREKYPLTEQQTDYAGILVPG